MRRLPPSRAAWYELLWLQLPVARSLPAPPPVAVSWVAFAPDPCLLWGTGFPGELESASKDAHIVLLISIRKQKGGCPYPGV